MPCPPLGASTGICSPHPGSVHPSSLTLLYTRPVSASDLTVWLQAVLLRGQRGSPALPAGYDPPEKLYSHPGSAGLRECWGDPPHVRRRIISDRSRCPVLSQCSATIIILCVGETHNLINYVSFINFLSYGVTIAGLLYFRKKKPNLLRPIKVHK